MTRIPVTVEEAQEEAWLAEPSPLEGIPDDVLTKIDQALLQRLRDHKDIRDRLKKLKEMIRQLHDRILIGDNTNADLGRRLAQFQAHDYPTRIQLRDIEIEKLKDQLNWALAKLEEARRATGAQNKKG